MKLGSGDWISGEPPGWVPTRPFKMAQSEPRLQSSRLYPLWQLSAQGYGWTVTPRGRRKKAAAVPHPRGNAATCWPVLETSSLFCLPDASRGERPSGPALPLVLPLNILL